MSFPTISVPNMKDTIKSMDLDNYNMDMLIDGACNEDGFPILKTMHSVSASASASASSSRNKSSKSRRRGTNRDSNANASNRQIAAAYEEHAAIIDKLKRELEESKGREKALVSEFTDKFKELQRVDPITFDMLSKSSHEKQKHARRNGARAAAIDLDEEMPMDEMADTARMERSQRTMEQIELKRALEGFKRQSDQEMKQLRESNQAQIQNIAEELQHKVGEIKDMKKKFDSIETECNYYKKQSADLEASMVTASLCTTSSSIPSPSFKNGNGNSPAAVSVGSSMNEFPTGSPHMNTPFDAANQHQQSLISPLTESPIAPDVSDRTGMGNLTPLQRLRNNTTPTSTSTSTPKAKASPQNSGPEQSAPSSRLDALFQKVTDPNLNSLHTILKKVEKALMMDNDEGEKEDGDKNEHENLKSNANANAKLSEGEREFVDRMKAIFESSQEEHVEVIESLKTELEETNNEFLEIESKSTNMSNLLQKKQDEIKDLREELTLANESVRNKSNLEGMLRMVASDQKSSLTEYTDLKNQLRKVEAERDRLRSEQKESKGESDDAVAALKRVMADVTAEKDTALMEMEEKLDSFASENLLLKQKLDPDFDVTTDANVVVDGGELARLRRDAKKCAELEMLLENNKDVAEDAEDSEGLRAELEDMRETVRELEEQLENHNQDSGDEMMQLQIDDLQNENSELKEKSKAMEDKLSNNEQLTAQTRQLTDDVSKLKVDVKRKDMQNKRILKDLKTAESTISDLKTETKRLAEENLTLEGDLEITKLQAATAGEVLKTARDVHARENELEDELTKVRELLEEAVTERNEVKEISTLGARDARLREANFKSKLQTLQMEIIEMKEEKLSMTSKVRDAEKALEHANRIMSLLQETSDTEGTASKAISDLKEQLYEQQELHTKLRHCCDESASFMIDRLDRKVHTTLCLLETGTLHISGASSVDLFDFSSDLSAKEQLMERTLCLQRTENDRIRKNIEELRNEKEQEHAILTVELSSLRTNYASKSKLLAEKDEVIKTYASQSKLLAEKDEVIKNLRSGYISDEYSDTDDDEVLATTLRFPPQIISKANEDIDAMKKKCSDLISAKESAQKEAKENAESLANAKMIISSLEQSNQTIVDNLKERLSDSNAAIVSLLDQSKKYEEQNIKLKSEIKQKDAQSKRPLDEKVNVNESTDEDSLVRM